MPRIASARVPFALLALVPAAVLGSLAPRARAEDAAAEHAGVAFEPGLPPMADVLAKARTAAKPVFVDFFTEW